MPSTVNRTNLKLILAAIISLLLLVVVITLVLWQIFQSEVINYSPAAYSQTATSETTSKFIMNQLFTSSTILTDNILTIEADLTAGWSVVAKDTTSIAFKHDTAYLTIRSLPESETTQFMQIPENYKVSTNNFGDLFSIKLNSSTITEFLHNRFNIQGNLWQAYAENYTEIGCTDTNSACSNLEINISNGVATVPLAINCVATSTTDLRKCDNLLKTMSVTLFIDD